MNEFLRVAWLVVRKDLRVESRSRELLFTTVFFAISCVLVFSFGFVRAGRAVEGAAAGILWIAIAFSGTLALGRAFERERYHDALRGLLLAPVARPAIYVGKLTGLLLLLAVVEAPLMPIVRRYCWASSGPAHDTCTSPSARQSASTLTGTVISHPTVVVSA